MSRKLNASQAIQIGLQLGQDLSKYPRPVRDAIVIHLQDVARKEDAAKAKKKPTLASVREG